jgi:hypothetical protein
VAKDNRHFAEEEWADFVHQQMAAEKMHTMQEHLDSGCERCSAAAAAWKLVHVAARRASSYEPPEWALRYVRNTFTAVMHEAQPQATKKQFQIPRLVFDSLWQPAAAGVRSIPSGSRQMRYKADELSVELRLGPLVGSERISVAGQVFKTAENRAQENLAGMRVIITSALGKIVEALTNQFGEFQMSFLPGRDLNLYFAMSNEKDLFIPLDLSGVRPAGRA